MKQKNALILAIVWLLVMVSVVASTATLLASGRMSGNSHWVSGEEYEMLQRYARLEEVRQTLVDGYYQEVDDETLMTGALKGMMAILEEPYTFYYTPDEMASHNEQTEGAYHGVGLLVQNNGDGYIEVLRVYEGGPSHTAGVQVGDLIVRVDGRAVYGTSVQTLNEAVALMKGEDGSEVVATVIREGERMDIPIIRGDVAVNNVAGSMIGGSIGYINIFQFSGNAVEGFEKALDALQANGARSLIIDLRNNPGGILDDVVAIADMILPEGCIVYTEDRAGSRQDYYSDAACCELPVVVLINGMSASASEILAAAVQDFGRGTVIGSQSYGKGVVQNVVTFEDDGAGMQYTSACYYTPSGKNIHGTGVTPDIAVDEGDFVSYSGIPNPDADAQLRAAIQKLQGE